MATRAITKKHVTYMTDYEPTDHHRGSKVLVSIDEVEGGMFVSSVHTVSRLGNLSTQACMLSTAKTFGHCLGATKRVMARFFGHKVTLGEVVLEGQRLVSIGGEPCFFCDPKDESVNERFCEWARSLFPEERIIVKCYRQEKVWTDRQKAMDFYQEAWLSCEGSEAERYANIYFDLQAGLNYCDGDRIW